MLFLYPSQQPQFLLLRLRPSNKCNRMIMMKRNATDSIITKEIRAMNVGLSLNIMTKMATDIRYGKNIVDLELLLLEFFLGYHTYGVDRYRDDGTIDNRQYIYDIAFLISIYLIA